MGSVCSSCLVAYDAELSFSHVPIPRAKDHPRAERALRDGQLSGVETVRQQRQVCDKGAQGKVQFALVFSGAWHVGGH